MLFVFKSFAGGYYLRQKQHKSGVGQPGVPVGLITRRSEVQILPPLIPKTQAHIEQIWVKGLNKQKKAPGYPSLNFKRADRLTGGQDISQKTIKTRPLTQPVKPTKQAVCPQEP